jgi:uncharacterized membrane protein YhhN
MVGDDLSALSVPSLVWLAVAALFAVGDWVARARSDSHLEYVCKPGALAALIGTAVALSPAPDAATRRSWFVAALVCSLVGDVLLMLPTDRFVAGLAAFLVAHVCYLGGLWARGPGATWMAVSLVVVVATVAPVGARILGSLGDHPELRAPVAIYMAVIAAMFASALAVAITTGNAAVAIGAALFVSSDAMIAWNRFVRPFGAADVGIMVTYHLGQAGLVLSLLH